MLLYSVHSMTEKTLELSNSREPEEFEGPRTTCTLKFLAHRKENASVASTENGFTNELKKVHELLRQKPQRETSTWLVDAGSISAFSIESLVVVVPQ